MDEQTKQDLIRVRPIQPGLALPCPCCGSKATIFVGPWLCLDCEVEFKQSDTETFIDQESLGQYEQLLIAGARSENESSQWEQITKELEGMMKGGYHSK